MRIAVVAEPEPSSLLRRSGEGVGNELDPGSGIRNEDDVEASRVRIEDPQDPQPHVVDALRGKLSRRGSGRGVGVAVEVREEVGRECGEQGLAGERGAGVVEVGGVCLE